MNAKLRAALAGVGSLMDLGGLTTRNRLTLRPQPWDDVAALDADMGALVEDHNRVFHPGRNCRDDECEGR